MTHLQCECLYRRAEYTEEEEEIFAVFQGTSNGGRQFLSNRLSNRHIVPLYGKSARLFTRAFRFEVR